LGKPAARVGDAHKCPMADPVTGAPHGKGVIVGPGNGTVLIGGKAAAVAGDACTCTGAPNVITGGSAGVFIGGKPAARKGDGCAHGGKVTGGLGSVLIGERIIRKSSKRVKSLTIRKEWVEPPQEEKEKLLDVAIQECTALLERKLNLIQCKDPKTMDDFKEWFGYMDEERLQIVQHRIERALVLSKMLTVNNFDSIPNEFARTKYIAIVNCWDEFHTIYLGDPFWKSTDSDGQTKADTLVHELSHFWDIGHTFDFQYDVKPCKWLSENNTTQAFYNAESFMYFIKA
jgi:uncharacterized Zn-binding protein involved in type VI secretion